MLQYQIYPAIQVAANNCNQVWFQQDGAPPHYGLHARDYLNNSFPFRWIGRRGRIEWPPRSLDLSSLE